MINYLQLVAYTRLAQLVRSATAKQKVPDSISGPRGGGGDSHTWSDGDARRNF